MDNALDDIVTMVEEAESEQDLQNEVRQRNVDDEQGKAVEMRKRSLETLAESRNRNGDAPPKKRNRSTGSETLHYLEEKLQLDSDFIKEEIKWRKEKEGKELQLQEQKLEIEKAVLVQQAKERKREIKKRRIVIGSGKRYANHGNEYQAATTAAECWNDDDSRKSTK